MIANLSATNLKKVAKICGIPKYSKMSKNELLSSVSPELSNTSVKNLREVAKLAKVTGYSRKNKSELLALMVAATPAVSAPAVSAPAVTSRTEGLSRGEIRKERKALRKAFGPGRVYPENPGYMTFNEGKTETWNHGVVAVSA